MILTLNTPEFGLVLCQKALRNICLALLCLRYEWRSMLRGFQLLARLKKTFV